MWFKFRSIGFRWENDCKDLELGVRATVECHACHCSSSFSFHSVFTLPGSMPGGDANHHNNMQQHSSLVYMHSSHRGCCPHCNGGTLVCVTVWKKSFIIDPLSPTASNTGKPWTRPETQLACLLRPRPRPPPSIHLISLQSGLHCSHIISYDCCSIFVFFTDSPFEVPGHWIEFCM